MLNIRFNSVNIVPNMGVLAVINVQNLRHRNNNSTCRSGMPKSFENIEWIRIWLLESVVNKPHPKAISVV